MTNHKPETMPGNATLVTLRLAEQLISCCSVTPDDGGCMDIIVQRLKAIGFKIESFNRGGVTNIWARRGTLRPLFCFAGHTDVVPSGPPDQWQSDPFQPTQRDTFLFGRGAADMKSSLAAFVTATEAFVAEHPQHGGSIAFLLTSDEEGDATDGTAVVIDSLTARGESIDYCVIGEPTAVNQLGDTIKNGRRGSLSGRLTIKGVQGHVAYPHLASNPIHIAAPALVELAKTVWDQGNECFPPTTWQTCAINSGTGADNVIPGQVEVRFNFRFGTATTAEALKEKTLEILKRHAINFDLDWSLSAKPYLTPPDTLVNAARQAIHEETGLVAELSTTGGSSDGRFIAGICREVVEIGPVNASIHKIDECIDITSLPRLSAIYHRILNQLLP